MHSLIKLVKFKIPPVSQRFSLAGVRNDFCPAQALSNTGCQLWEQAREKWHRSLQSWFSKRRLQQANQLQAAGLQCYRQGRFQQAVQKFDKSLRLNPGFDQAYNNRANCHAALGEWAEAISDYEEALNYNPTNLPARINQGIALRELGLLDSAIENFDTALFFGRRWRAQTHAARGRTYHLRGDWNCAMADYQRALTLLTNQEISLEKQVKLWISQLLPAQG
ncbi:MAG: tetratricopeptide repeat protein [Cyanobacteria bacterium P01_H01_bin.15]